ncbi:uncharacterized protein FTOL_02868 [Fusarium torulosum]|uniref:Uncharacterized protein n=1 Tax=Fusarium torulosum TaxID=33205 RepID=A0AAE8SF68_9HYPO|nr:uncharacterized protein FTOL_02868 [Fusarium torulosum]
MAVTQVAIGAPSPSKPRKYLIWVNLTPRVAGWAGHNEHQYGYKVLCPPNSPMEGAAYAMGPTTRVSVIPVSWALWLLERLIYWVAWY